MDSGKCFRGSPGLRCSGRQEHHRHCVFGEYPWLRIDTVYATAVDSAHGTTVCSRLSAGSTATAAAHSADAIWTDRESASCTTTAAKYATEHTGTTERVIPRYCAFRS